jgi:hypothetical protein
MTRNLLALGRKHSLPLPLSVVCYQVGGDEGDDRLMAELDRLRKENAALRGGGAKGSSSPAGGGAGGDRAAQLDKENKDLKKTIDNLMEANAKLVSNTKTKIAVLEGEVERYRAGGGGAVSSGGGGDGEAIRKLQVPSLSLPPHTPSYRLVIRFSQSLV